MQVSTCKDWNKEKTGHYAPPFWEGVGEVLLLFFSIICDELLESFFCAGVIFGSIHARLIQIFRSQLNSFLLASCT